MSEIRMIASDIDGTLLPVGWDRIPERVLRALQSAGERGIQVVPVSGRLLESVPRELLALPVIRYVITCNGAAVLDQESGKCIYERRIPAGLAAELLRRLREFDVYTSIYLPDGAHNWNQLHPGIFAYYRKRVGFFSQRPHEDLPAFVEEHGEAAEKIFVAVFRKEERERIRREIGEIPGIQVTSSSRWNLEINDSRADKGTAVAWLGERLGFRREEILVMGDNENDSSMLSYAGTALVPADGTEAAKAMATELVPACADCGMAEYIEERLLKA